MEADRRPTNLARVQRDIVVSSELILDGRNLGVRKEKNRMNHVHFEAQEFDPLRRGDVRFQEVDQKT